MSVPTEAEIRDAAARLGLADENGGYRQRDRARIAAAIQKAKQDQADDADPANATTAQQLGAFASELAAHDITSEALLVEAARHLFRSQGLRLAPREETTP
ncbi:hypothetical protein [Nocardia otitidiscaviarum]|uniref:hypothetical protein n=1 Tax=Nocardia otitidiscaviarum TaxID=1823 RepID=UPI0004A77C4B|nr:hypothetical protein [Nocardia otitidiscaviarum]